MINYNEFSEFAKSYIDDLVIEYIEDMENFPLAWVECAYNRALRERLKEIDKKEMKTKMNRMNMMK